MARPADRAVEDAGILHQELNRLYEIGKQKVDQIKCIAAADTKRLSEESKEAQKLMRSMQVKLTTYRSLGEKMISKSAKSEVTVNATSHDKQLAQLQRHLREYTTEVQKNIEEEERNALFKTSGKKQPTAQLKIGKPALRTSRLGDLVVKMSERVAHSEQTVGTLVNSSSVLAQTHAEYESQAGHIKTGNKLLSKYEHREFTEKILLTLAILLYAVVVYYILQKRVLNWFRIF